MKNKKTVKLPVRDLLNLEEFDVTQLSDLVGGKKDLYEQYNLETGPVVAPEAPHQPDNN